MTEIGRGKRIRTSGPCLPKAVLYQAELFPDHVPARQRRWQVAAYINEIRGRKRVVAFFQRDTVGMKGIAALASLPVGSDVDENLSAPRVAANALVSASFQTLSSLEPGWWRC